MSNLRNHLSICAAALALLPTLALADESTPHQARGHEKRMDEIEVTANPLGTSSAEAAKPAAVIAGGELEDRRRGTIGETVSEEAGVQSSYFGPGVGRPVIRGQDGARVQVLSGGTGALDASTVSVDHALTIEPFVAEQIEVLKGPSTLFYGAGAIGGVVNVVDGRIPDQLQTEGVSGRAELSGDTGSAMRGGVARIDATAGQFAIHGDAFLREADNVEAPGTEDGEIENSAIETSGGAIGGVAYADGGNGFVGLALSGYNSLYGIPGGAHEHDDGEAHDAEAEAVRIDMSQTRIDLKAGVDGPIRGVEKTVFKFTRNDYEHAELEGDAVGTRFENEAYEARLELNLKPLGAWTGAVGLQASQRDLSAIGEEAFVPANRTDNFGIFLIERADFAPWSVELGLRHDRQDVDAGPDARAGHDAVSLSLAGLYAINEQWQWSLSIDRAERAPTAEELFSYGPHIATQSFEVGQAGLETETAQQFETGLRYRGERFEAKAQIYRNDFSDFIYLAATGAIEDDLPVRQWSQADATFTGYEIEAKALLADNDAGRFDLRLFSDSVDAEFDDGSPLPRIAPQRLGAGLEWQFGAWHARLGAIRTAEQSDVSEFETATPGYTLVNAHVSYAFLSGETEWEAFIDGSNLTDREAHVHTSFLKDNAPLPGRNLRFGLRSYF
ncbi:MAG TPA: TonB-dependent receptor [Patescibacteria group bacterium]|nr:TonB-dependent receptor [Patescibacteria group bacterium]